MNKRELMRIFKDNAYVRMGGTGEELKCAEYIAGLCSKYGETTIEPFPVEMGELTRSSMCAEGVNIRCKGYMLCGSGTVSAPLYYLTGTDKYSLSLCKDKIVMIDGYLGYWRYQDIINNGGLGIITYDGNINYPDRDIDYRELRSFVSNGVKIPCVNINVKDALKLIKYNFSKVELCVAQNEYSGESRNVVLTLPGEIEDEIVFTAHYDSTSLSEGAYDNMSGSVGLIALADYFSRKPHRYTLRFVWCGSEERGLLGSKAYCSAHEEELGKIALCINLDMIGSAMGHFIACCTSEEKLVSYLGYMGSELGFGVKPYQDVYSSDSTPFSDKGIPSVSFARIAPKGTGDIHNSYDTTSVLSADKLSDDISFITAFADRMANSRRVPVAREIPESVKEKLDIYLLRKRDEPKVK